MTLAKTQKTQKMLICDVYSKLGRHNKRIEALIRSQHAAGCDLEKISETLDAYYQVASPGIYTTLQAYKELRIKNASNVLADGIVLHHTNASVLTLDTDNILARVRELTTSSGT